MRRRERVFRVVCMFLSVMFFMYGVAELENEQKSYGLSLIALAFGALAYSNVIDPDRKENIIEALQGRVSWSFTPVGSVLYIISLLLFVISFWLWIKYD